MATGTRNFHSSLAMQMGLYATTVGCHTLLSPNAQLLASGEFSRELWEGEAPAGECSNSEYKY